MKVQIHPADTFACGCYRLIWPARALQADGHDIDLRVDERGTRGYDGPIWWSEEWYGDLPPAGVRVMGCDHPDADVVVLQRPVLRVLAELVPHLQAHGVAVVVEVDDDYHALPSTNHEFVNSHPRRSTERNRDWLRAACLAADLVTCTTPALAERYAPHGRYAVIPNYVPQRYLQIARPVAGDRPTVGWSGSMRVHRGDLAVTRGAVARALEATGAEFMLIGTNQGDALAELDLTDALVSGQVPIEEYPVALACLDVGIVPLANNAFNMRGKSNLKMSEMAALGVPVVASPTRENEALHGLGVGTIAASPADWERELRGLLVDVDHRAEHAAAGRSVMAGRTIEGNAWRWAEAWAIAAANRVTARLTA